MKSNIRASYNVLNYCLPTNYVWYCLDCPTRLLPYAYCLTLLFHSFILSRARPHHYKRTALKRRVECKRGIKRNSIICAKHHNEPNPYSGLMPRGKIQTLEASSEALPVASRTIKRNIDIISMKTIPPANEELTPARGT